LLKYLEIDYKRLKLKINKFSQINLITGANNIGKTSLLEACSFAILKSADSVIINQFQILEKRDPELVLKIDNNISFLKKFKERVSSFTINSNISNIKFINSNSLEYLFSVNINSTLKEYKEIINPMIVQSDFFNSAFIVDCGGSVIKLKEWYYEVKKNQDEKFIIENIRIFDSNIEIFDIIDDEPSIKIKNKKEFISITEAGDGLKRFIFILLAFYKAKNGYIFIDEFENGIWYKNYDLIWKNIILLSKKFNTQIFITTHSKEVIDSFVRICNYSKFDDVSFVELISDLDNNVKSIVLNKSELEDELLSFQEVRGW